jgi:exopolysaccharide biosynthesis WecB/TagA/CpsF family protein
MITAFADPPAVTWPPKFDLFGVRISAATCEQACDAVLSAARCRQRAVVSAFSVHALIEAASSRDLSLKANGFAMILPDGQPVRWALNWLHGARLKHNVRGSDLMWQLCRRCAAEGISIYFCGSTPETLAALAHQLRLAFPAIEIAGAESPPFRPLSLAEDTAVIDRINSSGARLVFIGLGSPKQDHFAAQHVAHIEAVQVCVGAAFDFHAGTKPTAPLWMQRRGLEWLFRLCHEPRRLWKRYLYTNTKFIAKLAAQLARERMLSNRRRPSCADLARDDRDAVIRQEHPLS